MDGRYIIVEQICCTTDTQFANRMSRCEDPLHTAAGVAACVSGWCGYDIKSNIDGVVILTYSDKPFKPQKAAVGFIGDDNNYISDHNGVNLEIDASRPERPDVKFNIITHNLEGLCYRNDYRKMDRFKVVRNMLPTYFAPYIGHGTIFLVQELALQLHAKDMELQGLLLNSNMDIVLSELKNHNANLVGIPDGYTGCIIYDRSVWTVERTIKINRIGSNKYSNAYCVRYQRYPDLLIWVVNIHLKAFGGGIRSHEYINNAHVNELANILDNITRENENHYPVYLCGDFNNGSVKAELIMEAMLLLPLAKSTRILYNEPPDLSGQAADLLADAMT
jgi:hypothetical protein